MKDGDIALVVSAGFLLDWQSMQRVVDKAVRSHPAWDAAEAYGIDMSQIETQLRLTPAERIQRHRRALATVNMLIEAVRKSHGRS